jgi:hypothetical protein
MSNQPNPKSAQRDRNRRERNTKGIPPSVIVAKARGQFLDSKSRALAWYSNIRQGED